MNRLERAAATRVVLARAEGHPVLANLGSATYDLFGAGDRALNLYTWGAMGQISSVALGLAVACPDRRVIVLDGDGSLLMNLGVLATIAARAPRNLLHLVWDDGSYVTTGGQPTHTAGGGMAEGGRQGEGRTDLGALARAAGYPRVEQPATEAALDAALARALSGEGDGPCFIHVRVAPTRSSSRPPRDPIYFKYRFMAALAGRPLDAGPPLV